MALLAATVSRRSSTLIRPTAAAASMRRMCSSSSFTHALRAEAASLRAEGASLRAEAAAASDRSRADTLRASSHDRELIHVIKSVQSHNHWLLGEIPKDFPFQISENDGLADITLTRRLKGEQIEVLVSMPTSYYQDELQYDGYTYSDENQEDNYRPRKHTAPLSVIVSKADGTGLDFLCTAYPDKIVIDSICVFDGQDTSATHEIAHFSELDEKLQHALHKYLELRGITAVTIKIFPGHTISKDRRQHLIWLTMLSDFIKKD